MNVSTLRSEIRNQLPGDIGQVWADLVTPCLRLRLAHQDEMNFACILGGLPMLPVGMSWPTFENQGDLDYVGAINLAVANRHLPEVGFPESGSLHLFIGHTIGLYPEIWDSSAPSSSLVLYVPDEAEVNPVHPNDDDLIPFPRVELVGEVVASMPSWEHPMLRNFTPFRDPAVDRLVTWMERLVKRPAHQVGGVPLSVQGPVEWEVPYAMARRRDPTIAENDRDVVEAAVNDWVLLAQIDTDASTEMFWGDAGMIYFMIHRTDLRSGRFDRAVFDMQCC